MRFVWQWKEKNLENMPRLQPAKNQLFGCQKL